MRKFAVSGILALSLITWAAFTSAGPGCKASQKTTKAGCAATCLSTASAKGCHTKELQARKAALDGLDVATTRLPSGALLVLYTSENAESVKALQASASTGSEGFDCRLCQSIAADKDCTIELGMLENGVVAFVISEDTTVIDSYEKQFAVLLEQPAQL